VVQATPIPAATSATRKVANAKVFAREVTERV
jgi:exopolyphosphatase/pppGpp-phosphohydrolase